MTKKAFTNMFALTIIFKNILHLTPLSLILHKTCHYPGVGYYCLTFKKLVLLFCMTQFFRYRGFLPSLPFIPAHFSCHHFPHIITTVYSPLVTVQV